MKLLFNFKMFYFQTIKTGNVTYLETIVFIGSSIITKRRDMKSNNIKQNLW